MHAQRFLIFTVAVALVVVVPLATSAELPWAVLKAETLLSGLNGPIDFSIAPDGSVWWNEYYTGDVTRYDPADGSREVVFHADPLPNGVERGMVGLALDPDVVDNGVFYVYYTVADPNDPAGGTNRLSRIDDGNETILLTLSAYRIHNGGRIVFARDGSMFVSTGENDKGDPAQDPSSLLGKILHVRTDGTPADGNVEGPVYSLGHRNVYGLAYDAKTDRLFATENGNAERDEVNLIEGGNNYGWPACEGFVEYDLARFKDTDRPCDDPKFTPPIGEFYADKTAAPTGATIYRDRLYWASWNEGAIHRMVEDKATKEWIDEVVFRPGGRINDLETDPTGSALYYSNWTHIFRLEVPNDLADQAPATPDASPVGEATSADPDITPPGIPDGGVAFATMALAVAILGSRRRPGEA